MRRSAAPSSRHGLLGKPPPETNPFTKSLLPSSSSSVSMPVYPPTSSRNNLSVPVSSDGKPAARSTASVLSLLGQLKKTKDDVQPAHFITGDESGRDEKRPILSKENAAVSTASSNVTSTVKRIFRVVWGKPTAKKHKTWEGDGTLEVGEKTATLKDEEGKVLGRATQVKTAELDEGSRLKVGSKEVESISVKRVPGPDRKSRRTKRRT